MVMIVSQVFRQASGNAIQSVKLSAKRLPSTQSAIQVADLCAYPCARHVLDANKPNLAFEVVKTTSMPGDRLGACMSIHETKMGVSG